MTDAPGLPALRWSADHECLAVAPGVEADDFRLTDPVASPGEPTLLALQAGTNRFVVRAAPPGSDVAGPASATDNAVARFSAATGKVIKNSTNAFISDAGVLSLTAPAGGTIELRPNLTTTANFPVGSTGLSGLSYAAVDIFYYVG